MEPVSDWSPTDFSRREGVAERMRTAGVPVSCRNLDSDETR
jgi:hypothetical protein